MAKVNVQTGENMEQNYKGYVISIIDLGASNTKVVVNSDSQDMDKIYKICGGGNNFTSVKAAKEAINS